MIYIYKCKLKKKINNKIFLILFLYLLIELKSLTFKYDTYSHINLI